MADCRIIRGVVVEEGASPPVGLPDLLVVLGGLRHGSFAPFADTVTNADGEFAFDLDEVETLGYPSLGVKLYRSRGAAVLAAHGTSRWSAESHPGPILLCVEPHDACAVPEEVLPSGFTVGDVYGRVRHSDGTPIVGLEVEMVGVTLAAASPTGVTTTLAGGWYRIAPPTGTLGLQLRVRIPGTPPELVATSRACFSPAIPLRVDIDVCDDRYRQDSEFARLYNAIHPKVAAESLTIDAVNLRAIAMLSGATRWDVTRIGQLVVAHKLAIRLSANAELLYGLLRLGWPASPSLLLRRASSSVEAALAKAQARNYIGIVPAGNLTAFLAALVDARKAEHKTTSPRALKEILIASGSPALLGGDADLFIDAWVNRTSEVAFWTALPGVIGSTDATEARRMMTLGIVGLMWAPAVVAILTELGSAPAEDLVDFTDAQWANVVDVTQLATLPAGLPGDDAAQRQAMKRIMREHVDELFGNAKAKSAILLAIGTGAGSTFLNTHTTFDFGASNVDDFSGTDADKAAVKRFQRLYLIAPTHGLAETVVALNTAGFSSAQSITRLGRTRFLSQISSTLDPEIAAQVYARALRRHAGTLQAYLKLHPRLATPGFAFLREE